MKKILLIIPVVLAIAMIYGYSQSGKNELAKNHAKQAIPKDFKEITKPEIPESKVDREYFTLEKAPERRPSILLILTNDKSMAGGSASFLRNFILQAGC